MHCIGIFHDNGLTLPSFILGAGPGGGLTFHGGGHGGAGGGSWRDPEYDISYGKPYTFFGQILGGSTGKFHFERKQMISLQILNIGGE